MSGGPFLCLMMDFGCRPDDGPFDTARGHAGVDTQGFEGSGGDGAETEHSSLADVDAGRDDGASTDPRVGTDLRWCRRAEGKSERS